MSINFKVLTQTNAYIFAKEELSNLILWVHKNSKNKTFAKIVYTSDLEFAMNALNDDPCVTTHIIKSVISDSLESAFNQLSNDDDVKSAFYEYFINSTYNDIGENKKDPDFVLSFVETYGVHSFPNQLELQKYLLLNFDSYKLSDTYNKILALYGNSHE
jgi:hypothetical protein